MNELKLGYDILRRQKTNIVYCKNERVWCNTWLNYWNHKSVRTSKE